MTSTEPSAATGRVITTSMLSHLPLPVQRYLAYTGVVGKPWIDTARIQYSGKFRTAPRNPWMAIRTTQHYRTDSPAFQWNARFAIAGLPLISGVDTYRDGHAHIHGKFAGLVKVIDGKGEEVDLGTMTRFLQEMCWFPTAYLSDYVEWAVVDDHCADVSLRAFGKEVHARMYFDDEGRLLTFTAKRWGDFGGQPLIKTWSTPMYDHAVLGGLRLPTRGLGIWQLEEGDFAYVDIRLTDVRYNVPVPLA